MPLSRQQEPHASACPGTAASVPTPRSAAPTTCSATGFGPGFNGRLTVAAEVPPGSGAQRAADATAAELEGFKDVAAVSPARLNPAKDLALISVTPSSGPSAAATEDLVNGIRARAGAIEARTGATVWVTGRDRDRHRHVADDVRRPDPRTSASWSASRCSC